jgi:hypothetical protein
MTSLRSSDIYWHSDDKALYNIVSTIPVELMTREQLEDVVKYLDTRLVSLWLKVTFERQYGLVSYKTLQE